MAATSPLTFCRLPHRALLSVRGADADSFLQGLMSVNVLALTREKGARAGVFLNAKGRVRHHVIAYRINEPNVVMLDCDSTEAADLEQMLHGYKLKKKVQVQRHFDMVAWTGSRDALVPGEGAWSFQDPRPGRMGSLFRMWAPPSQSEDVKFMSKPGSVNVLTDSYHAFRMAQGIPERSSETQDEIPFQLNMDYWPDTLVYDKGCYVGQELIARTHYKGIVRKRVLPFAVLRDPKDDVTKLVEQGGMEKYVQKLDQTVAVGATLLSPDGNTEQGSVLSISNGGQFGLAIVKNATEFLEQTKPQDGTFKTHIAAGTNNVACSLYVYKPSWWPSSPQSSSSTS